MFIYGRQPVLEALRSAHRVKVVYKAQESSGKVIAKIEHFCLEKKIPLKTVNKNQLQKWVGPVVHQGIVAELDFDPFINKAQFEELLANTKQPFLLMLDHIQDTHNFGAILRTAEIAGVDCIIVPGKGNAPLNATVAKTSAGAMFYLKFLQTDVLEATLQDLNTKNLSSFAATPHAKTVIYEANFKQGLVLVIGSEDKGVRKNLLKYCRHNIKIPQFGRLNSLNASVSTAVILFEVVRQRNFG